MFYAGGREYMTLVGHKGLSQGLVLPFLYNVIGSCADRFVSTGCGFLQYADDLLVYVAHWGGSWAYPDCLHVGFFSSVGLAQPLQSPRTCCFAGLMFYLRPQLLNITWECFSIVD
jgi:hypothetical protein